MNFQKYMHIERFGTEEVEGIEMGLCYIFPKIDGTNSSCWLNEGKLCAGSRNREISLENDNAEFMKNIIMDQQINNFFTIYPNYRLYGEYLVPHSLKIYRQDAWKKFYVFDVADENENLLHYDIYSKILDSFAIDYIPPIAIIKNPTYDNLIAKLEANVYLVQDGQGSGEGIVIKNYEYKNKFGRQVWAKIVKTEFQELHKKEMGIKPTNGSQQIEELIVKKYLTIDIVDKVFYNIKVDVGGWHSKLIPRLLNTVFYDLIREEGWIFIKEYKFPKIDYKVLQRFAFQKIKELKPNLF